jgi:hypothetical protein
MWYISYGCCDVIIKYEDINSKLSLQYLIKPGSKKWRRRWHPRRLIIDPVRELWNLSPNVIMGKNGDISVENDVV